MIHKSKTRFYVYLTWVVFLFSHFKSCTRVLVYFKWYMSQLICQWFVKLKMIQRQPCHQISPCSMMSQKRSSLSLCCKMTTERKKGRILWCATNGLAWCIFNVHEWLITVCRHMLPRGAAAVRLVLSVQTWVQPDLLHWAWTLWN